MAAIREQKAPKLSVGLKGIKGDTANITFYQNSYVLIDWGTGVVGDPLYDLFVTLKTLIEALSDAKVYRYNYLIEYTENAFVQPVSGANMQDVGKFVMNASNSKQVTVSVPALKPAKLVQSYVQTGAPGAAGIAVSTSYGQQMVNVSDADVMNFVQFLLTGAEGFVPAAANFDATGSPVDLVGVESAYLYQERSPNRSNRQG